MIFSVERLNLLGTIELESERFILRKFKMSDAEDIYSNWLSDADSARYNAWKVHTSIDVTKDYLSQWVKSYKNKDYFHWAIEDRETGEVIGSIIVSSVKRRKKYCEIGYTIAKKLWNKGIATEVLICVLKFLTDEIGFQTIAAFHDERNRASGRVMKKAGMEFVKNQARIILNSNNLIMKGSLYEYRNP